MLKSQMINLCGKKRKRCWASVWVTAWNNTWRARRVSYQGNSTINKQSSDISPAHRWISNRRVGVVQPCWQQGYLGETYVLLLELKLRSNDLKCTCLSLSLKRQNGFIQMCWVSAAVTLLQAAPCRLSLAFTRRFIWMSHCFVSLGQNHQ